MTREIKCKFNSLPRNIYTKEALISYLKIPKPVVNKILKNKNKYSINFKKKIKEKDRDLTDCEAQYKHILRKINSEYLQKISLPNFVHSGPKERSVKTALVGHIKYNYHIKLDFKNYFPSIKTELVSKSLKYFNVPKNINIFLSNFCTRDNVLPQGYPTSPIISAIVTCFILKDLELYKNQKISFYVDDGIISSDSMEDNQDILKRINDFASESFISINELKTETAYKKYVISDDTNKNNTQFKILGMVPNDNIIGVPRSKVMELSNKCFKLNKDKESTKDVIYLNKLHGSISYVTNNSKIKKAKKLSRVSLLISKRMSALSDI